MVRAASMGPRKGGVGSVTHPPSIYLVGGKVGRGITHPPSFYPARTIRREEGLTHPSSFYLPKEEGDVLTHPPSFYLCDPKRTCTLPTLGRTPPTLNPLTPHPQP